MNKDKPCELTQEKKDCYVDLGMQFVSVMIKIYDFLVMLGKYVFFKSKKNGCPNKNRRTIKMAYGICSKIN